MRSLDHYWGIVISFVTVVAAFTILCVTSHGEQGTLLRAVMLTLGGAVAGGYIAARKSDS